MSVTLEPLQIVEEAVEEPVEEVVEEPVAEVEEVVQEVEEVVPEPEAVQEPKNVGGPRQHQKKSGEGNTTSSTQKGSQNENTLRE